MGHIFQKQNDLPMEGGRHSYHDLMKDSKHICRIVCINPPIRVPSPLIISDFKKKASSFWQSDLPHFPLRLAGLSEFRINEWKIFTNFLHKYNKAACAPLESGVLYIIPLESDTESGDVEAFYQCKTGTLDLNETIMESKHVRCSESLMPKPEVCGSRKMGLEASISCRNAETVNLPRETVTTTPTPTPTSVMSEEIGDSFDVNAKGRDCNTCVVKSMDKNYIRADPSYLRTLGQTHSGWIFGAIAELVDNSRDARASKLEISIETLYSRRHSKEIPVLSVFDDGHGMSHEEIVTMLSLGRKAPDVDDIDRIGRFGIGFKSGAMRIGRDAIVLTQTSKSRSIAFLSHSLNEGKDNLEIPIVSYIRQGSVMEVDTSVQSEASAGYHLKVIKEYSPFNEYLIGEKLAKFREKGTGTQIYIWNLDEWGSNYFLEWQNGRSPSHVSDILIRSRRIRSRPGQISLKVPLDYSLRSYLEVIFLEPRMKIYVQGSLVKSRPLAKSLNKTTRIKGDILGKPVQLTLGRSKLEWEQMNCGIFLYWHGRLIEAYKRVGSMVHNADIGRGVIGVIDVTDLMNDGKQVWVHNDKQGFQDCEAYAKLEDWLGGKTDAYWDDHFDTVFVEKSNETYEPNNEWVQCDKCRKWRILISGYDSSTLPLEWFCCMTPYNGKCDIPEQQVGSDVITVAANRSGCDSKRKRGLCEDTVKEVERKLVCDAARGVEMLKGRFPSLPTDFQENPHRSLPLRQDGFLLSCQEDWRTSGVRDDLKVQQECDLSKEEAGGDFYCTVIVGMKCIDGVMVGADARSVYRNSQGKMSIRGDKCKKLAMVTPSIVLAATGSVSSRDYLMTNLQDHFYKLSLSGPVPVMDVVDYALAFILDSPTDKKKMKDSKKKKMVKPVTISEDTSFLIAGWDDIKQSQMYIISEGDFVEEGDLTSLGCGGQYVKSFFQEKLNQGILNSQSLPDPIAARDLVYSAVHRACLHTGFCGGRPNAFFGGRVMGTEEPITEPIMPPTITIGKKRDEIAESS